MIDPEDLRRAQAEAKRLGITIGAALIKLGFVDESALTEFLAKQYGCPAVDLSKRTVSEGVKGLVPRAVAARLLAMPIERVGSVLIVAMADPSNVYATEELGRLTGLDIEVVVSSEPGIRAAIERLYAG